MKDLSPIFRRVAAINPVPDETDLPATVMATTALLDVIDERNGTLKTQHMQTTPTEPSNRRRTGGLIAVATFSAIIAVGAVVALLGNQGNNASPVGAVPTVLATDAMIPARDVLPGNLANSMEDTIRTDSFLTIDRSAYDSRLPERLDIVLYENPREFDALYKEYVSRVIGLPGETLEVRDGVLYVDGRIPDEPFLLNPHIPMLPFGPITLAANEVWLMGDNRQNQIDSRDWGPIPISELRGEVTGITNP